MKHSGLFPLFGKPLLLLMEHYGPEHQVNFPDNLFNTIHFSITPYRRPTARVAILGRSLACHILWQQDITNSDSLADRISYALSSRTYSIAFSSVTLTT